MPRFYFNVSDGSTRLDDEEGMVLPDAEAAWYHAFRSARELIGKCAPAGFVEIKDEEGYPIRDVRLDALASTAG
jgi:hypothetical protein